MTANLRDDRKFGTSFINRNVTCTHVRQALPKTERMLFLGRSAFGSAFAQGFRPAESRITEQRQAPRVNPAECETAQDGPEST
jgi:hypothetical protein